MRIFLSETYDRQAFQDLGFDLNTIKPFDEDWSTIECPQHLKCEKIDSGVVYYTLKYNDLIVMLGFVAFNDREIVMNFDEKNVAIVKADSAVVQASKRHKSLANGDASVDNYPHPASLFFSSAKTDLKDFNSAEIHPASIPGTAP
jgi:hypothetical protein